MKRLYSLLAALLLVGCATTQVQITPAKVRSIAQFAAQAAAAEALDKNPKALPDLKKARLIIATMVAAQQWDIAQLAGAFQMAGFKELHGAKGVLIVEGAVLAMDLSGHSVDLKTFEYAQAAMLGALDGLNLVVPH